MTLTAARHLSHAELVSLADEADRSQPCPACSALRSPGWESISASADRDVLVRVGTLRDPAVDEPDLQEYHPQGTHGWSAQAPIAPAYHPYNRCDVWACSACRRAYLRYTEYGGYYQDERIRELRAELIVPAAG